MAQDQNQDRTEQPTPKRRKDAKKKGEVARSRELTMSCVMLAGAGTLLALAEPIGGRLIEAFSQAFHIERSKVYDVSFLAEALADLAWRSFIGLVPLAVALILAALAGGIAIGGWSFSISAVGLKTQRMNPIKGLKRIFSANALNELVKAVAKFAVVAVLAVYWLWWSVDRLLQLGRLPVTSAIQNALEFCGISLVVVSAGLLLIAAVDVPFQLVSHSKKLRMTRQEVRDEFKETEGRPEVKSRIRTLQQQIATQRMMEEVPTADVVITNPTHVAVALRYDGQTMTAPKVVAKGKGIIAARIRELAEQHNVPLFSAPPLARALHRSVEIGNEIPARLFSTVAQVLAYIYQLDKLAANGQQPPEPPVLDLDEEEA